MVDTTYDTYAVKIQKDWVNSLLTRGRSHVFFPHNATAFNFTSLTSPCSLADSRAATKKKMNVTHSSYCDAWHLSFRLKSPFQTSVAQTLDRLPAPGCPCTSRTLAWKCSAAKFNYCIKMSSSPLPLCYCSVGKGAWSHIWNSRAGGVVQLVAECSHFFFF